MTRMQSALKQAALAAALGALIASPAAFADGHGKGHGHGKHQQKAQKHYAKAVQKAQKEEAKAYKRWAKGQTIPREYVVERYYVTDYRDYGLAPPPVGYQYVQPYPQDDSFYLVQLASGLISQIFN
jgi:Ni/Co efflux regulator RcnB